MESTTPKSRVVVGSKQNSLHSDIPAVIKNIPRFELKSVATEINPGPIRDSASAAAYSRMFYDDDIEAYESMFLILLNLRSQVIGYAKISQGTIANTPCDTVLVAKYAILALSPVVILVHNHPTGFTEPSESDKRITIEVKKALDLFKIKLQDHIILAKHQYFSFRDDGFL